MVEAIQSFVQANQVLSTGVLGFAGVILTLLTNARLQRKQHQRQVAHDANVLRAAIKAELTVNKLAYEGRLEQFADVNETNHVLIPNKVVDNVYQKLLDKIGLLTEAETQKIVEAYLSLSDLPYRIRILAGTDSLGGMGDEYVRLDQTRIETAKKMHEAYLPRIIEAIKAIDNHERKHNK